jgi:uncharacterized protein YggU (UPF0235/DUF167 family)
MKDGTYIRVRVTTGAKKQTVLKQKDVYHISVKEKPERGSANEKVRSVLARELGEHVQNLSLIKGHTTPSKTYLLHNNK